MTKPKKAAKVATSKRKPEETLFPMGKIKGHIADSASDESVANGVAKQCGEAIESLRKIGREARIGAIKRIAMLLNAASPSTNTVVFLREKPEAPGADLFESSPKTEDSTVT